MNKRPRSITAISWLFIAAGAIGVAYHATEFKADRPFQYDVVWVCLVRLLAIVCGVFMLRGSNWARWGLIVWIAYHVVLSALHTLSELIMHSLLSAVADAIKVENGLTGLCNIHVTADSETWLGFLAKEKNLLWSLLTRRIRLRGNPKWLVAFGRCFPS